MSNTRDTITAISTAPGEAGIAIVRISGPSSLQIADRIFKGPEPVPSRREAGTFVHGFVGASSDGSRTDLDEVILLVYRAPHSYTKEDVVEIQGHGGWACAKRILRAVLDAGARSAEPGEFTKRAFLNGRIDLLQAEAVADLIMARSDRAASAAIEQLEGRLSTSLSMIYDYLINAAADVEASLDFPEGDLPPRLLEGALDKIRQARKQLDELLLTWEEGRLLRDGALIVISGKPNVGKSTLLNCLLGTDRAIVDAEPGTTRDTIEEGFILQGIPLRLVDTAGLREPENLVEREGIQRAQTLVRKADLNLFMYDSSEELDSEHLQQLKNIDPKKCIIVLNKSDLGSRTGPNDFMSFTSVVISLAKQTGIDSLKAAIIEKLGITVLGPPHASISERHRQVIQDVLIKVDSVIKVLSGNDEELLVPAVSTLRNAIEGIGNLTGKNYSNLLLDSIFSRFCIGK